MTTLQTAPELVVRRHAGLLLTPPSWGFELPAGDAVGTATRTYAGGWFGSRSSWLVADAAGPVWLLEQRSGLGRTSFELTTPDGQPVGTVQQENQWGAPQLTLSAADGAVGRLDGGRMGSWEWALENLDGVPLGRVTRVGTGLLDMMTKERTYVVRREQALPRELWPLAALACVCWDIVHERKQSDGAAPPA